MASLKVIVFLFVLFHAIFLLSSPVYCDDEDILLQGLNRYRRYLHLPDLAKNEKAECLADAVAEKVLEDRPCTRAHAANTIQLDKYPQLLSYCGIDIKHTTDGVVLPVCMPNLDPTKVHIKYTRTRYAGYIGNSRFTGAGVGFEDDWAVVILSTDTPGGSFTGANS